MRDPEDNPWTTVSTRLAYRNPWITVVEHDVVRPDGARGIYGVVSKRTAVGVVALTAADEVVLVGQWRYPLGRYSWELVEGAVEDGEEPQEAMARELAEEAGLVAATWEHLAGPWALSNSVTDELAHVFVATGLSEVDAAPEGTEVLQVVRVPFAEALARVDAGGIDDALSVLGLLALDRRRRRRGGAHSS